MTEEPPLSTNPFAPPRDPRDEPPIDAEIVDDPVPATPVTSTQPLIVTVGQLQEAVVQLQQGVQQQLSQISARLDALDQRAAAAAAAPATGDVEPPWVRRLEAAIDGLGSSAAATTAAAITTMGEQQRSDLAQIHARIGEVAQQQPAADPHAADLAGTVAQLCTDLTAFTDEVRRGFGDVATALHERGTGSAAPDPEVVARLDDIRAALRLVVG